MNLYAYCQNNPVMYYDPSVYVKLCPNGKTNSGDEGNGEKFGSGYTVNKERRTHILEGDEGVLGSGHGPNRNSVQGAFPDTWTDEQAIAAIERVANDSDSTWKQSTGPGYQTAPVNVGGPSPDSPTVTNGGRDVRFIVRGQDHGLEIEVIVEPGGEGIVTGYVK